MSVRRQLLCLAVLTLAASSLAGAQDAEEVKLFQFQADLGFVNVAGNTEVTTLNAGEKVIYTVKPIVLTQTFSAIYGRTDGETSASTWKASGRMDYGFTEHLAVFGLVGFEKNRFAGIDRRFEEAVGLAIKLLTGPRDLLETEAGVSLNQQRATTGVDDNFTAARGAAMYKHLLGEKAFLQQTVEALPNLEDSDDLRVNTETSLVAPLSSSISLKLAYAVRFDNQPEPGFRKTDRMFTSGVQVVF
jgi:putative salt-induced outer membrane protein